MNVRRLYAEDHLFHDVDGSSHIIHEFMLLYTAWQELFFVLAIFGYEFVINLCGPNSTDTSVGCKRTAEEPLYPNGHRHESDHERRPKTCGGSATQVFKEDELSRLRQSSPSTHRLNTGRPHQKPLQLY
jgi:hypothetical protein